MPTACSEGPSSAAVVGQGPKLYSKRPLLLQRVQNVEGLHGAITR